MSMSETLTLTREQRDMLKQFLPGFKLVRSASVEEQDMFWENVFTRWFTAWPERAVRYPGVPQEQELSGLQQTLLKFAIEHRQRRIKSFIYANTIYREMRLRSSTLNEFFKVKKLTRIGSVDEAMMPRKWTTSEQEEFLTSMFAEYLEHAMDKNYEEFLKKINKMFFERWPERRALFSDLPTDYVLMPDQAKALVTAVEHCEKQLATWYRWRKNPARLGCMSGIKGALKFDTVLAGGVELKGTRAPQKMNIYSHKYYKGKVKDTADTEIKVQNVTNRGPKLNKHREVTHCMYSEECEEVKNKIERKYQKAKAKHAKARLRQKSGKLPKIEDKTRINANKNYRAICELGPMLDRILKYLSYATGGWKFSILMGGNDPSTGEVSVFNYHVGELETGAQFDQTCTDFDAVQAAFLTFIKDTLAFELMLPQSSDAEEEEESSSDNDDDSDEEQGMGSGKQGRGHAEAEDLLLPNTHQFSTAGMYRMTQSESSDIEDDFDTTIASTDASLPCVQLSDDASLPHAQLPGDASPGFRFPSNSHFNDFNVHDLSDADPSVFDHDVFASLINDPNFDISILDAPLDFPPLNPSQPSVNTSNDGGTYHQYPEVFLPPVPLAPPATPLPDVEGTETQNEEAPTLPLINFSHSQRDIAEHVNLSMQESATMTLAASQNGLDTHNQ
ncbi:hypothetical protein F4604DRAFT_1688606 [Suillus subluteus]|nr:hypothetical protein F4604DRAFT_1688606 [Suillus subluteus]